MMLADVFVWLNNQPWWNGIATVIQYATLVSWGVLMHHVYASSCTHHKWCLRPGAVKIKGTNHKVCRHHARLFGHVH